MRGQHTARRQLEQCNARSETGDGRESGGVGVDDGAGWGIVVGVLCKVVGPVCAVGEQGGAVKGCGCGA